MFITAVVIKKFGDKGFFYAMMGINLVAIVLHLVVPSVKQKIPDKLNRRSYGQAFRDFMRLFKNPLAVSRIPVFLFSGIITGFFSSFLYVIVEESLGIPKTTEENKKEIQEKTVFVMLGLGAAQIISGIIIGKLNQAYADKRMYLFQITTNIW